MTSNYLFLVLDFYPLTLGLFVTYPFMKAKKSLVIHRGLIFLISNFLKVEAHRYIPHRFTTEHTIHFPGSIYS